MYYKLTGKTRSVKLDENFFTGYRKTILGSTEVLVNVLIPFSKEVINFYQQYLYFQEFEIRATSVACAPSVSTDRTDWFCSRRTVRWKRLFVSGQVVIYRLRREGGGEWRFFGGVRVEDFGKGGSGKFWWAGWVEDFGGGGGRRGGFWWGVSAGGGITWLSGETEGGSVVAQQSIKEEYRKYMYLPYNNIIRALWGHEENFFVT